MTKINPADNPRMSSKKLGKVADLEPPLAGRTFSPAGLEIKPDKERQKRAGRKSALAQTCREPVSLSKAPWE